MKGFFTLALVLLFGSLFAVTPCAKCDLEKVKMVNDHLDRLTFQMVNDFLCTFDSTCNNQIEFSKWSNETLFKVLEGSPELFFEVVAKNQVDNKSLLKEIKSPLRDFDLQKIYNKIKAASAPKKIKSAYLKAVLLAAGKDGKTIKK